MTKSKVKWTANLILQTNFMRLSYLYPHFLRWYQSHAELVMSSVKRLIRWYQSSPELVMSSVIGLTHKYLIFHWKCSFFDVRDVLKISYGLEMKSNNSI